MVHDCIYIYNIHIYSVNYRKKRKFKIQLAKNVPSLARDDAREAIRPMTVLSPQLITIARAVPST